MRPRLIGRGNELRRTRSLLEEGGVAVLVGPSGVGKTAICDSVADEWRARGRRVRELRGTQGLSGVPFGALTLGLRVEPGDSDADTLARVVELLTADEQEALVVVDDAHLLDPQSAGLVSGLGQSDGVPLALAITSGESISPDITSIWARWPHCLVEVDPLDHEGVAELLEVLLGREPSQLETTEIAAVSLGYPLYVTAIAHELANQDESDLAVFLESASGRLTSLMERRLARLDRDERELFDAVAFAESIDARIVVGQGDPALLEALEVKGLVKLSNGRAQVSHPLLGSVSRATLTTAGQRALVRRLLAALDAESEPGDVAAVVRKALGVAVVPDTDLLVFAAEAALAWGDYAGVARITALDDDDPRLKVLRARASRFLKETPPTEVPVGLDDDALTQYLSGTSQGLAYADRRFGDAIEFLKSGITAIEKDENRDRLAVELMVLSGLVGDIDALLGAARAVSPTADPTTRLLALSATQLAEALTLSTGTSDDTYQRGRRIAEEAGADPLLVEQLEMSRSMVELAEGRFDASRRRSRAFTDRTLVGSWLTIEAVMADAWLPIDEACRLADSAVAALETFDPLANLAQARIVADLRHSQRGGLLESDDGDQSLEPGVAEIDRIMSQRVDAWLAWRQDDPTAGKRLIEVGRQAIAMGHRFWGLGALIDATRLGLGEVVAPDVDQLVITRGARLAALAGRHARASSPADFGSVARMWWVAGAPVYALEAAIRAAESGNPADGLVVQLMAAVGPDPIVGDVAALPQPVSERQLEIVRAVLEGHSNDEIAHSLFISRRTVENHLHRLYGRLGIRSGRDELIERFGWSLPGSTSA